MPRRPLPYRRPVLPWERRADRSLGAAGWAGLGFEFAACVVVFFLGGKALDGRLGTAPLWTAIGSLLGVAAGMYLLIRSALRGQSLSPEVESGSEAERAEGPAPDASRAEGPRGDRPASGEERPGP